MKRVLKEEIIKLRKEGLTYKKIRERLGCTKSLISYHCKNAGMSSENARHYPTEEIVLYANKLYKEGKNLKEIAILTGKSRPSIKKYIKNYNGKKYVTNITHSESVVSWRQKTKIKLVEYKGGKCANCGYDKCIEALDFHHVNPLEKDFTIGGKSWAFETLRKEADKCILLCRNCHIEEHKRLRESS